MAENSNVPMPADDYDTPWKAALEHHFPEFLACYFPQAHAAIDWTGGHRFLDQELAQVVQDAELGRRFVESSEDMRQNGGWPGYSTNGIGTANALLTCSPSSTG